MLLFLPQEYPEDLCHLLYFLVWAQTVFISHLSFPNDLLTLMPLSPFSVFLPPQPLMIFLLLMFDLVILLPKSLRASLLPLELWPAPKSAFYLRSYCAPHCSPCASHLEVS